MCDICNQPFTPEEWEERHQPHEEHCQGEGCDCDLNAHPQCCPECNP